PNSRGSPGIHREVEPAPETWLLVPVARPAKAPPSGRPERLPDLPRGRTALVRPRTATEVQTEDTVTPEKKAEPSPKTPSQAAPASSGTRKPWTPRSPVDVV